MTSFGNGCGLPGYPGVYAKVTSALDWIYRILNYSDFDYNHKNYTEENEVNEIHIKTGNDVHKA